MADLIAVIEPGGQEAGRALEALRRLRSEGGVMLLEDDFARRLCGALGAGGALTLLVAEDAERITAALQRHGASVIHTALPHMESMWERAMGSGNPQIRGQRRRESGGESSQESGQ
ncbi:MAG TPA: hypothetical protein VNL77_14540 [Roseiflexaceae bacterium]|nr:hypothetical protein [Roseiflexaceae bacterium]